MITFLHSSASRAAWRSGVAALALVATSMTVAWAQPVEAPADSAEPPKAGNDIVVTALRRESTVQTTPMAITALTSEVLTKAGVQDVLDYAKFAPSLRVIDLGPGQRRISLRGVQAAGEPTVGTYFDDTPLTGSVGTASDAAGRTGDMTIFDVDRIEVLRGPQGTLYGASSMGGAIRIITKKPSQDFEGLVDGQVSTTRHGGDNYAVHGMVNVPLVPDVLAARAVLYRRHGGGYVDNAYLNRKDVNTYRVSGGRLALRFTPTENFTLDATAMFEDVDAFTPTWQGNRAAYEAFDQVILPNDGNSQIYNLTANWDFGGVALTSVTSYQKRRTEDGLEDSWYLTSQRTPARCASFVNGSASAACSTGQLASYYSYVDSISPAAILVVGDTRDFSQEVRLSSTGEGALSWTIGGFYQKRTNDGISQEGVADRATGEFIRPLVLTYRRRISDELKQLAFFGEGTYALTPKLKLTVGIRYFDYDKEVGGFIDIPFPLLGIVARPPSYVDASEDGTLLKFNASWEASPDAFFYATAAQGFRPGGANQVVGLPDALTAYEADKLWNYEAGAKLMFADRKVTLNLAAYQIDWDNIQVRGRTTDGVFSFLSNAGAARIRGVEAEAYVRPSQNFLLTASANYNDAKLSEDQINANILAAGRSGDRIPFIPHWTGTVSIEHTLPLSDGINLSARADVNYVGASYSEFRPTNALRVRIDDYALANARIGLELVDLSLNIGVFVNNLFDTVAINRGTNSSTINSNYVVSAPPRTIGVNLRRAF